MSKDPNPADAFKLMHAENKRLGVIETTPDQAASEREKEDIAQMAAMCNEIVSLRETGIRAARYIDALNERFDTLIAACDEIAVVYADDFDPSPAIEKLIVVLERLRSTP